MHVKVTEKSIRARPLKTKVNVCIAGSIRCCLSIRLGESFVFCDSDTLIGSVRCCLSMRFRKILCILPFVCSHRRTRLCNSKEIECICCLNLRNRTVSAVARRGGGGGVLSWGG